MKQWRKYGRFIAACLVVAACWGASPAQAAGPKTLTIAPLRTEKSLKAGTSTTGYFTVTNETDKPLDVALSVRQFSVKDYSYDYVFRDPDDKWITLPADHVTLTPHTPQRVFYTVAAPAGAAPGGHYFSLIAGTTVKNGQSIPVTMQVGTLLYLTVDGQVTQTGRLEVPPVSFIQIGDITIPYQFGIRGTGNTHFTANAFASLDYERSDQTLMVLPGTVRQVSGTLRMPQRAGLYDITYGYQIGSEKPVTQTVRVLYIPSPLLVIVPVLLVLGIFGGVRLVGILRRRRTTSSR